MDKSNIMCLHIGIAFYSFVLMEQKYREARRGSRYFALRRPVFSGYRPVEQTNRGTLSAEMFATGKGSAAVCSVDTDLWSKQIESPKARDVCYRKGSAVLCSVGH